MALNFSRLSGGAGLFQDMIQHFGVVTVMNADVYETAKFKLTGSDEDAWENLKADAILKQLQATTPICHLDTLKIANAPQEGPTKTVTGGQYANPLIKFGKSMRLEMQDALGRADAADALCGTVSEVDAKSSDELDYSKVYALHVTEDFNSPKTIVGDTFFIDSKTGQQVKVKIVFYQFLPDSIFNLTQDAEGDASVFDMNGDVLTTVIQVSTMTEGESTAHGVFYSIIDPTLASSDDSSGE